MEDKHNNYLWVADHDNVFGWVKASDVAPGDRGQLLKLGQAGGCPSLVEMRRVGATNRRWACAGYLDSEVDADRLGGVDDLAVGRDVLDLADGFLDGDGADLVVEVTDHAAEFLFP